MSVRWRSAAEPVCPSDDVPRQNWPVRPTTFHGRTGLEIRGPVRWVSGPRPTDGQGFFFSASLSRSWNSRSCPLGFRTSTDKRTRFFFFFFPPFSGGLPRVNTRVFFFFSRPFQAGCPGLIPGVFIFYFLFFRPFPVGCSRGCYGWEWIPKWIPESAEKKKKRVLGFKF